MRWAFLAFYESGFLKAEALLKHGEVLGRQMWQDGEKRNPSSAALAAR